MKISTRSRYGLRLMLDLALNYEKGPLQLNAISRNQKISLKYLSQLVIQLKLSGLINSTRGSRGGYFLTKPPGQISVKDIVEPLEGGLNIIDCNKNGQINSENNIDCPRKNHCVTIEVWKILSDKINETLAGIKLSTLIEWDKKKRKEITYFI
jgi:Rrf2 family protein